MKEILDVHVSDLNVIRALKGIDIVHYNGVQGYYGIRIEDSRIETANAHSTSMKGATAIRLFVFYNTPNIHNQYLGYPVGVGPIRDIEFSRITIDDPNPNTVKIEGWDPVNCVSNVRFHDILVNGRPTTTGDRSIAVRSHATNIWLQGELISPADREEVYRNGFERGGGDVVATSGWKFQGPNKGSVAGPTSAQKGNDVMVTYPGGNCPPNVMEYATLPPIRTVGMTELKLEFKRWLNVFSDETRTNSATVEYSLDGTSWDAIAIYENYADSGWVTVEYPLPEEAEGRLAVYLRFGQMTSSVAETNSFGWCIDDLTVTAVVAHEPPQFTSTPIIQAVEGENYTYHVTTSDPNTASSALRFLISDLPAGLSFIRDGNGGGSITGLPETSGVFPIYLSVFDGIFEAKQNYTLVVMPAGGNTAPSIVTASLPYAAAGEAYSTTVHATDAESISLAISLTASPDWLSLVDHGNGTATLSGIPPFDLNETQSITLSASDGFATTSKTIGLLVIRIPIIGTPGDQFLRPNSSTTAIPVIIGNVAEEAESGLILSATSSNQTLLPANGILLGGSGTDWTITLTPMPTEMGTSVITLTIDNGTIIVQSSFILMVLPNADITIMEDRFDRGTGSWFKGSTSGSLTNAAGQLSWLENGNHMAEVIGRSFPRVTLEEGQTIRLSFDYRQQGSNAGGDSDILRVGLYNVSKPISAHNWAFANADSWKGFSTFVRDNSSSANFARAEGGAYTSDSFGPFAYAPTVFTNISEPVYSQFNINDNGNVTYQCTLEVAYVCENRMDTLFTMRSTSSGVPTTHFFIPGTTDTIQDTFNTVALRYTNPAKTVFFDNLKVVIADVGKPSVTFSGWQQLNWPGITDPAIIGINSDPDGDGMNNLMEWALHLNPHIADSFQPVFTVHENSLQFTYTRRKTAPGEVDFLVEWSDTLGDDWSTVGVLVSPPQALDETSESLIATIPVSPNGLRFVRVRILVTE